MPVSKDRVETNNDIRTYEEKVAIASIGVATLDLSERRVMIGHRLKKAFEEFVNNPNGSNWVVLEVMMSGYQHVKKNERVAP